MQGQNIRAGLKSFLARLQSLGGKAFKFWEKPQQELMVFYVEEKRARIFKLNALGQAWKVEAYYQEEQKAEGELFAQEILFVYLKDLEPEVQVIIIFSADLCVDQEFFYPPDLQPKEIKNSLNWDLSNLPKDYLYAWDLVKKPDSIDGLVKGLKQDVAKTWQAAVAENNKELRAMVGATTSGQNKVQVLLAKDLLPVEEENFWIDVLGYGLGRTYSFMEQGPCKYNWPKITKVVAGIMVSITAFTFSFWQLSLMNFQDEATRAAANGKIYQQEVDKQKALVTKGDKIKGEIKLLAQLRGEQMPFYAMTQALATVNVDGVVLTKIKMEKNKVTIEGNGVNLSVVNEYRSQLKNLQILTKEELVTAQKSQEGKQVHFLIEGEVAK